MLDRPTAPYPVQKQFRCEQRDKVNQMNHAVAIVRCRQDKAIGKLGGFERRILGIRNEPNPLPNDFH